jgi:hypothetical protein
MRLLRFATCAAILLTLVSTTIAAPQDTKPAQATAEAFVKAIVAKDFDAFKALCTAKLQAEHAKNPKNCLITRWWTGVQKELTQQHAKWVFKKVQSNLPGNVTLDYTRTMDSGSKVVQIGVRLDGGKWLVDSAGSL